MAEDAEKMVESTGFFKSIFSEILESPLNIGLVAACIFLIYRIIKSRQEEQRSEPEEKPIPKMKKRDFTILELKQYTGQQEDGRVLIAVNGKVYDVTKGKRFYGPGGPYAAFAGTDASRGLATFNVAPGGDQYDDLSDLSPMEMESVKEWELQFNEKYEYVGRLLKPGEQPNNYSDEEDESNTEKSKDE
ncbi:membrane-associated progesterone receptor component 1-like [Anthonomus grandis grandis]|uniref:membrane-associated progesterone receptor component 1-like n=1 Tax=Anthonomus grandis grandis TaxID=2921223 RepID=UPI0021660CEE|nr:membrane-associated progesterone receptor component 1-like [Anthonomus grandis grandis]